MTGLSFENWIECLRVLHPPTGIIHIGAGGQRSIVDYPAWDVKKALLIEANPRYTKKLEQLASGRSGWKTHVAAIDRSDGDAIFNAFNLAAESGLIPAESLTALWPNLKTARSYSIATHSLDSFLTSGAGGDREYNWLLISCLGADRVLEGAEKALSALDVIVIRAELGRQNIAALSGKEGIGAQLEKLGYMHLATEESANPMIGHLLYTRTPQAKMNSVQDIAELKLRHQLLSEELEQLHHLLAYLGTE